MHKRILVCFYAPQCIAVFFAGIRWVPTVRPNRASTNLGASHREKYFSGSSERSSCISIHRRALLFHFPTDDFPLNSEKWKWKWKEEERANGPGPHLYGTRPQSPHFVNLALLKFDRTCSEKYDWQSIDMPADGSPTTAHRLCSHLANASEAAPVTASLQFRPLPVAVWWVRLPE